MIIKLSRHRITRASWKYGLPVRAQLVYYETGSRRYHNHSRSWGGVALRIGTRLWLLLLRESRLR